MAEKEKISHQKKRNLKQEKIATLNKAIQEAHSRKAKKTARKKLREYLGK